MFLGRSKRKARLNIKLPEIQKSPYFDHIKPINTPDSKASTASNTPPTQEIQIQTDFPYQNSVLQSFDTRAKSVAQINFPSEDTNFPNIDQRPNVTRMSIIMLRNKLRRNSVNNMLRIILNKKIPNNSVKREFDDINKGSIPQSTKFVNSKLRSQSIIKINESKLPILNGIGATPVIKNFTPKKHRRIMCNNENYAENLRQIKRGSFTTTNSHHPKSFSYGYLL